MSPQNDHFKWSDFIIPYKMVNNQNSDMIFWHNNLYMIQCQTRDAFVGRREAKIIFGSNITLRKSG